MDSHNILSSPRSVVLYKADTGDRFISFPGLTPTSTTTTTNEVTLPPLLDGEYAQVIPDSNTVLHTVGYIRMSIYIDASGTTFAQDSSGNDINNKLVSSTIYTYAYTDLSGSNWDGYFLTYFDDGTTFGNNDTNNGAYWYTMEGLGKPPQQYT